MNFWDHHKAITCYYELLMSSVCQKYQLRQMEYDILMFYTITLSTIPLQILYGCAIPPSLMSPPR